MAFEQQQFNSADQVNGKDRAREGNPQLNLVDLQNGSHDWGHDHSRGNGSAEHHLPNFSLYNGSEGAQVNQSGASSAESSISGGANNATPLENATSAAVVGNQPGEAGISNTAQSTAASGSESNMLQNISSTLQNDVTNLSNALQRFTTDVASAENSLGLGGDTQQPSPTGADNTGATRGSTDANGNSEPSFMQQLQSLMNYLGMPGSNSSPESTTGTPPSNSDTTPPPTNIANNSGETTPVVSPPNDSTQPPATQNNNPVTTNNPGTSDVPPAYNTATDPAFNALQAQSPEAAQILSAAQPSQSGMTSGGYSNFEQALTQTVNGGQYNDVASAGSAAALMLQQSGDAGDSALAVNAVNNVISQNGDAPLANAATPPADNTTPTPPADNTTPTPPADNTTPTPPADTTTPTPPADNTTPTPPADGTTPRTPGTPFASNSIFNMPLGSGATWQQNAQLSDASVYVNTVGNYNENIYTGTASDPLVTVTNDAAAGGEPSTLQVHIPDGAVPAGGDDKTFTVNDTATGTWDSFGGFQWTGPNTATASQASSEPFNGSGTTQDSSDWDEGVGTLTSADVNAGTIDHMLRVEMPTTMLESYDPTNTNNLAPYAYPQTAEDGFANNGDGGPAYTGTVPYGVTIGIPEGTPEPADVAANAGANMLWTALQTHGAMVRDSGGSGDQVIYQADQNVDPNSPIIQGMDQYGNEIMAAAQILTNQGPNSINGGGTPVVPLDAPVAS